MWFGWPPINPKACEPAEEEVSDDKDQLKPFACIKKRDGETYCGREFVESKEHVFHDAPYALSHYRHSKVIAVCIKCAARCDAAGVGQVSYQAPMALRGIRENTK